jgi:hypothetical protein
MHLFTRRVLSAAMPLVITFPAFFAGVQALAEGVSAN